MFNFFACELADYVCTEEAEISIFTIFYKDYLMNIFDRWGNLVFSTNSSKIGWDGTHLYRGNAATNGVYFYSIQYCIEEIVVLSGSFTLLR